MKVLAIGDAYIPTDAMRRGLESAAAAGFDVEVRMWEHSCLEELQRDNLQIEERGPDAVVLPSSLTDNVADVEVLVVQFPPVSRALMERMPKLKVIGVLRTGVENVDIAAATERGIGVLNTPGRNARAVAECTVGLMLAEMRNLARAHAALAAGRWTRDFPNRLQIPEIGGKTIGLVGYGAVARLVAKMLSTWDAKIIAHDPFATGDTSPATLVDLETLLRTSDIVSLHARYSEQTAKLINRERLAMMKPTAILVNTARSGLIDEPALVDALRERRIAGAALDVFDAEPLPATHPLVSLSNVTLAPHLAGSTIDAFLNSPRLFADHLLRWNDWSEGKPISMPLTLVNPAAWGAK